MRRPNNVTASVRLCDGGGIRRVWDVPRIKVLVRIAAHDDTKRHALAGYRRHRQTQGDEVNGDTVASGHKTTTHERRLTPRSYSIPTTALTRMAPMPMGIMYFQPMFINWS